VRRLGAGYGGRICVDSEAGVGSAYYFTLPIDE
jgi:signal transduction histidine kinase